MRSGALSNLGLRQVLPLASGPLPRDTLKESCARQRLGILYRFSLWLDADTSSSKCLSSLHLLGRPEPSASMSTPGARECGKKRYSTMQMKLSSSYSGRYGCKSTRDLAFWIHSILTTVETALLSASLSSLVQPAMRRQCFSRFSESGRTRVQPRPSPLNTTMLKWTQISASLATSFPLSFSACCLSSVKGCEAKASVEAKCGSVLQTMKSF